VKAKKRQLENNKARSGISEEIMSAASMSASAAATIMAKAGERSVNQKKEKA